MSQENKMQFLQGKETIRQLVNRHLRDQKHITTDEELRNALIEVDGTMSDVNETGVEKKVKTLKDPFRNSYESIE